ncbi:unnamed protein product [Polarella glacialis]|uniref:E3 ubiquitin-protein ligase CHFR n=1 Tax=Polarella glacialis TaxID=89957 RepID=A0A813L418_POLGL|nr:unnamed protein product [Polarella glacialis]
MANEPARKRARSKLSAPGTAALVQPGTAAPRFLPANIVIDEEVPDQERSKPQVDGRSMATPARGAPSGRSAVGTGSGATPAPAPPAPETTPVEPGTRGVTGPGENLGSHETPSTETCRGLAFLRLSSQSQPSMNVSPLIYLNKEVVTFGRLPSNDIVLDSKRMPQMISRAHGRVQIRQPGSAQQEWIISDCGSMNGITVNGEAVPSEGKSLRTGDVISFGRRTHPPEFEFVFEAPPGGALEAQQEVFAASEQMQRITELEKELKAQREQNHVQAEEALKRRQGSRTALNISEISSELACCICRDWLVHAATIECSHSFCHSCIDRWLQTKQFVCPVCRKEVTREPVRTRAVDTLCEKTVGRLSETEKADYQERLSTAEASEARNRKLLKDLQQSVDEAIKGGKNFFSINQNWRKRDKELFAQGVKEYTGCARETYCRLTGLTVQWVHSADEDKLNQALHNLALTDKIFGRPVEEIRRRLLMYLQYG